MTNDYPGRDRHDQGDGWQPLPQGEYDSDATAFVQLPPDGFPDAPLAAPGHGYVPPQITVSPATGAAATDPAATGVWVLPPDLTGAVPQQSAQQPAQPAEAHDVSWPEAGQGPYEQGPYGQESYEQDPYGQQPYGNVGAEAAQGQTGQWSIPVADGELPDESGEFTASALAAQWGDRMPPATLPGGAPAPWATQEWMREPAPAQAPEPLPEPDPMPAPEPVRQAEPQAPEQEVSARAWAQEAQAPAPDAPAPVPDAVDLVPEAVGLAPEAPAEEPEPESEPAVDEQPVPDEQPDEQAAPAAEEAEPADQPDGTAEADPPEQTAEPEPVDEPGQPATATTPLHDDHPLASYVLRVNGADRPVTDAWIGESLLYVLRERLGLAGAKDGCSQGECGACNVQVDGRLVASCLVPAATAAGSEVRTVEGLAEDGQPSDVQRALAACGAVQCGFCVPGMAMTVHDLLEGNPDPTDLETRKALCGNLCRCSGYRGVLDAVREVAEERKASARSAAAEQEDDEPRIPRQAGPAGDDLFQDGGQA
ncbi:2Fe-2S iron-sulfur cluster-binding protein [Streptomyces sp. NPDC057694]|uniref:2Fe-2S iron-sulfur cluster-binding protein n=1 Tax=Streptomyces sp. NPDC057694 TaxID=3346216 RepID=UPI0036A78D40